MEREFCCSKCGLIWFDEKMSANEVECPECKNNQNLQFGIYACDSTGWFYVSESVVESLHSRKLKIHYDRKHPLYGREK